MKKLTIAILFASLTLSAMAQKYPSLKQVEEAGQKPYLRYTPAAEMDWVSVSLFSSPSYGTPEGKALVASLSRGTAEELTLTSEEFLNEFTKDYAHRAIFSEKAIILYSVRADGVKIPLYLADCTMDGKKWFNRIRLAKEPPTLVTATPAPVATVAQANPSIFMQPASAPGTQNVNVSTIPGSVDVNLHGLPAIPIQPGMPANMTITYRIIHEEKRDAAAKAKDYGFAAMGVGVGIGVGAAPFKIGGAIESLGKNKLEAARVTAASNERVAITNGEAQVRAAAALRPANLQITSGSTSSPVLNQKTDQTGATVTATATPQTHIENNPKVDVNAEGGTGGNASQTQTAQGGEGGLGGDGGAGAGLAPGSVVVGPTTVGPTNVQVEGNKTTNNVDGAKVGNIDASSKSNSESSSENGDQTVRTGDNNTSLKTGDNNTQVKTGDTTLTGGEQKTEVIGGGATNNNTSTSNAKNEGGDTNVEVKPVISSNNENENASKSESKVEGSGNVTGSGNGTGGTANSNSTAKNENENKGGDTKVDVNNTATANAEAAAKAAAEAKAIADAQAAADAAAKAQMSLPPDDEHNPHMGPKPGGNGH